MLILDNITRRIEIRQSPRPAAADADAGHPRVARQHARRGRDDRVVPRHGQGNAQDRFIGIIGEEAQRLSARLDETVGEFADSLRTEWPLEDMRGADLIAAARRRIEGRLGLPTKLESVDESIWLNVDSYSLMQAHHLPRRAGCARSSASARSASGSAAAGQLAHLDLIWTGAPLGVETTMAWQTDSMEMGGEACPLTLKQIVERHNAEIWYQIHKPSHREYFRIAIPGDPARRRRRGARRSRARAGRSSTISTCSISPGRRRSRTAGRSPR